MEIVVENNTEIQKVLKELNLENKQLTKEDTTKVFEYMQEIYSI